MPFVPKLPSWTTPLLSRTGFAYWVIYLQITDDGETVLYASIFLHPAGVPGFSPPPMGWESEVISYWYNPDPQPWPFNLTVSPHDPQGVYTSCNWPDINIIVGEEPPEIPDLPAQWLLTNGGHMNGTCGSCAAEIAGDTATLEAYAENLWLDFDTQSYSCTGGVDQWHLAHDGEGNLYLQLIPLTGGTQWTGSCLGWDGVSAITLNSTGDNDACTWAS